MCQSLKMSVKQRQRKLNEAVGVLSSAQPPVAPQLASDFLIWHQRRNTCVEDSLAKIKKKQTPKPKPHSTYLFSFSIWGKVNFL